MGALLKRKEKIGQDLDERREQRPPVTLPKSSGQKPSSLPKPKTEKKEEGIQKGSAVEIDETTTTGRLLAMKKKRAEQEDDE